MKRHLADERFPSVWNTFMVCRFLSYTSLGVSLLPLLNGISQMKDPAVAYPALMAICRGVSAAGRPSSYKPSPFTE